MLEFVAHFQPSTKEEVYDIMNALDDRLSTPNSAVVLAAVKVFLNLTLAMPYDHQQVGASALGARCTTVWPAHHQMVINQGGRGAL